MKTWNDETCVRFRAYRRGDKQWIRITDGDSCFSQYVGYSGRGGEQRLTLSKNGCRFYGLCLHELGHVIGLDHEHVRSDRDEHLQVNLAGVPRDLWAFFSRRTKDQLKTYDSPYDLQSVMHYGASSLSLFADKTPIDVKDPNMRHVLRDVYIKETSFWDARAVNLHYQCQEECQSARPSCDFPGYVDKFCKCQQPAEFSRRRCVDVHGTPECRNLAEKLECYRNASFMSINCRKTCGFCYKDKLSEIEKPPKQELQRSP
uniref:Metalloendopeptidase n=1 Tax=Mesocestoides corti TaxID=53468 RepID=A0A5K3FDU9_MESCO